MSKAKRLKRLKAINSINKVPNYQGLNVVDSRNSPGRVQAIIKEINIAKGSQYFKQSQSLAGLSYNADKESAKAHREMLIRDL